MIPGAVFGGMSSKEDYAAVMNYARVTPPEPKANYVDIAGGDSAIDLTEAVGGVAYGDGKIEFMFTLFSREKAERMKNDIHGKRMDIILEREPEYFYNGRLSCTKEVYGGRIQELYFEARIQPYKQERTESIHVDSVAGVEKEILLENDRMPAMLKILVEGEICLEYGGMKFRMAAGEYQVPELTLYDGLSRIRLSGNGSIRLTYRKGRLA